MGGSATRLLWCFGKLYHISISGKRERKHGYSGFNYEGYSRRNRSKKWKQLITVRDLIEIERQTTEIAREIGRKS